MSNNLRVLTELPPTKQPHGRLHAVPTNKTTDVQSSSASHLLLQMQRQYGNRYLQRAVDLSRRGEDEGDVANPVEQVIRARRPGGQPLDSGAYDQMEPTSSADSDGVHIYGGGQADNLNRSLRANAVVTGQNILFKEDEYSLRRFSGHELLIHRSSSAQMIQRRIMMATGGAPPWREMTASTRASFLGRFRSHWRLSGERQLAARIAADLAAANDDLRFDNESELATEIRKRLITSTVMRQAQMPAGGVTGFAYPFRSAARYYGPRVNYAARDDWAPLVPDNYATRRDGTRRAQIDAAASDNAKAAVYGDPRRGYEFRLTPAGRSHAYRALVRLFVPQPVHKKTLIHCDYFVSLVHYRSFADSLGETEFNRRVQVGNIPLVLKWNGFADIEAESGRSGQTVDLQRVRPSRTEDLVIGDHVYFFNHPAYDPLIQRVGGVWRLENAVLVDRQAGVDYFLGHGSGLRTGRGIKVKLLEQYNQHVLLARRLIRDTQRGTSVQRANAQTRLRTQFPALVERVGSYFIVGQGIMGVQVDTPLRLLTVDEIPGLYDPTTFHGPTSPGTLYTVRRPIESR